MIGNDWDGILKPEFQKDYFRQLSEDIREEYRRYTCYPPIHDVFNALRLTSYENTKVLLLGQDPYHNPDQAMGLAFSVKEGVELPPSLENIFKELHDDIGCPVPTSGDLTKWGKQGVLLLNAILSVRRYQALSHDKYGWTIFTDHIISLLNEKKTPVVFVLWGSYAKSKKPLITNPIHFVIENVHPSPLSAFRGFFGSKPFSRINEFLESTNQDPVDFSL
ncbi:MAG TPA: uracil-DNA glycosylase [Bacillota bacterium]|nr:uracil-DNA glycosylase [Bacillota bacterium]HPF42250.1 uracil-DNA glycosylase [Bacillota bacterium]HPJ85728.1 uracil-DNA glycosylase [Bacillota bacterium]HPQ61635.1 uracil-DNA glycosylase [Bacillota bacterium]HRX91542.1 uracil-DNA glycosylase [Candidatus Izemoplasmatales bacterium]